MISEWPKKMNGAIVAVTVLMVLFALPASAYATRTLGLSAGTFNFEVPASGELTGVVVVSAEGDEAMKVMVYASDQKVDENGEVTYVAPTRADISSLGNPSSWVRIAMPANSKSIGNIPYLELAPGEKVPVEFSLSVPPDTTPGDHNVLIFFESFDLPEAGETVQSTISGRLGSRITMRVPGELFKKLEVRPFNVPAFVFNGEVPYDFVARNLGNVDQRLGARILFLDRNGNEVASQTPINGRTSFAGSNMPATGTVLAQGTAIGPYTMRLDVTEVDDDGKAVNNGKETITQEKSVWLIPFWLLVVAGILIAVIVVRVIWMSAVSSTNRKQARQEADKRTAALRPDDEG